MTAGVSKKSCASHSMARGLNIEALMDHAALDFSTAVTEAMASVVCRRALALKGYSRLTRT